jgi:ATP-dependent Clp protease ATP-binding subunit ClpC
MLTLDMSEFMERHQVSRLLGSPPGYVGFDAGGQLTEFVRRRPYCILLFDEIEKAHVDTFDLLLQILEDGRLTDARGQVVDFKNTLIIMTSNLGTSYMKPVSMSFSKHSQKTMVDLMRELAMEAVKKFFRPELLYRMDEVVFFHPLENEHLQKIVDLFLQDTSRRLSAMDLELKVTPAARNLLVERGYEPVYGARPLMRAVQTLLEDQLAEAILNSDLTPGDLAEVDVEDGRLVVRTHVLACSGARTR